MPAASCRCQTAQAFPLFPRASRATVATLASSHSGRTATHSSLPRVRGAWLRKAPRHRDLIGTGDSRPAQRRELRTAPSLRIASGSGPGVSRETSRALRRGQQVAVSAWESARATSLSRPPAGKALSWGCRFQRPGRSHGEKGPTTRRPPQAAGTPVRRPPAISAGVINAGDTHRHRCTVGWAADASRLRLFHVKHSLAHRYQSGIPWETEPRDRRRP